MKTIIKKNRLNRVTRNGVYIYVNSIFFRFRKGSLLKVLVFTIFLIFNTQQVFLYAQSRFKITGSVTDAATGKPIYLANVFLANTTLGSTTNKSGLFIIKNVPSGNYELLVSMMGYKVEKKAVKIFSGTEKEFNFELKPMVLQGENVTVTAKFPKEWRQNLKIFKRIYFGKSEFADKCEFKNPEVLDLKYDKKFRQFRANTDRPLVFINKALGYEVTVFLKEYYANLFQNDDLFFIEGKEGKPETLQFSSFYVTSENYFKELTPRNDKEKKRWAKNRLKAYHGSKRHFFMALIHNKLKIEGFKIRGAQNYNKHYDYSLKVKDILKKTAKENQYILSFPELLKVIYKKENDEIGYELHKQLIEYLPDSPGRDDALAELAAQYRYQVSWLDIVKGKSIILDSKGYIIPNRAKLEAAGYWYWDSPAESLPIDYKPDPQSIKK